MMPDENTLKLAALHRHWLLADAVRSVLTRHVPADQEESAINQYGLESALLGRHASMLFRIQVWYALLYVVVEGYRDLHLEYGPLEEVLAKDTYVSLLKRFRNATFHYQADPINDKLMNFLAKEDSEHWIAELNEQLETFFMQALPIAETVEKIKKEGMSEIPAGSKLETLLLGPRKA